MLRYRITLQSPANPQADLPSPGPEWLLKSAAYHPIADDAGEFQWDTVVAVWYTNKEVEHDS